MSGQSRALDRALEALAGPAAVLAPLREGEGFGVFPGGDRRRRPTRRLSAAQMRTLNAAGAIAALDEKNVFVLTPAGRARVARSGAAPSEAFLAQHAPIVARTVVDAAAVRPARGVDSGAALKRLSQLRDPSGAPFLSAQEIGAAQRLRDDWEAGQAGLIRGSDWTAPPRGAAPRAPGEAQHAAMARGCDARRRVERSLEALAAPLRRVVTRVCLHEDGLETLERQEGWPARSGKIALKLGLAQLEAAQRGLA